MEHLLDGIKAAVKEMRKKQMRADTVIINDRLLWSQIVIAQHSTHPVVCGLRAYYADELPEEMLFAVAQAKTQRESIDEQERLEQLIRESEILCNDCGAAGNAYCTEALAKHILANGGILPPCKVGDTAYMLIEDDFPVHKWYISEERVTEVGTRGFWVSSFEPPTDDPSVFIPYEEVGSEAFFDRTAAEAARKAKEAERDGVD